MRRHMCQMWNYTPEELDLADARRVMHETALIDIWELEMRRKAEAAHGRR